MNYLKKIFRVGDDMTVARFWEWFAKNEKSFYTIVSHQNRIDQNFLDKLFPKLQLLNSNFYCQTGMYNNDTAELIITSEGDIKTFVFVEELVAAAPVIGKWRFTALTPPIGFHNANIEMDGYRFNAANIKFISNETAGYPDKISITLVHEDFNESNKGIITRGTMIYLENSLGELNTATLIDNIEVTSATNHMPEPIPIEKLGDFLIWKEKEFIEKYDRVHYHMERENYVALDGKDKTGLPMIAIINKDLMDWEGKASYPWMMLITIAYEKGNNGMPDKNTLALLNQIEDELSGQLALFNKYVNLGRMTYNSARTIYFACKEFRFVSKQANLLLSKFGSKIKMSYEIYKDKYWATMNQFGKGNL